jgi:hypothetical protein
MSKVQKYPPLQILCGYQHKGNGVEAAWTHGCEERVFTGSLGIDLRALEFRSRNETLK